MINNGLGFFPSPYGSTPFINCDQWPPSVQQNMAPSYYNPSYQQQQQTQQQITNGQNDTNSSFFKLYDFEGNNQSEIIRFIFSVAGISFKDKRVKQEEWERVKDRIPIQKLPILRVNNQMKIYYLNAIVRYLAREFHLYGTGNNDHTIVDIIFELNYEFQKKLFEQINNSMDNEQKKQILTQFLTDHGLNYLNQLEKLFKIFNRQGPFYLGTQISLADLIVYQTINYFIDIDSKLLDNYSHLQQARHHLEKHPQLANYFNKKNFKIKEKRHKSVPPISRHTHHEHRHRSHDERKSSHRRQPKQESKPPGIELNEDESILPLQTNENTHPKEKESASSLPTKQEFQLPSIPPQETKSMLSQSTEVIPPPAPVVVEEKSELIHN
jgi:glutathione S-transferase